MSSHRIDTVMVRATLPLWQSDTDGGARVARVGHKQVAVVRCLGLGGKRKR